MKTKNGMYVLMLNNDVDVHDMFQLDEGWEVPMRLIVQAE